MLVATITDEQYPNVGELGDLVETEIAWFVPPAEIVPANKDDSDGFPHLLRRSAIDYGRDVLVRDGLIVSVLKEPLPGDLKFLRTYGPTAVHVGNWCNKDPDSKLLKMRQYLEKKWKEELQKREKRRFYRMTPRTLQGSSSNVNLQNREGSHGTDDVSPSNGESMHSDHGYFSGGSTIPTVLGLQEWLKEHQRNPGQLENRSSTSSRGVWTTQEDPPSIRSNTLHSTSHLKP